MKAVMYHYVRQFDAKLPHFRFLDVENFKKQLSHFEEAYGFVSRAAWQAFVSGEVTTPPNGVVLTFDDAMSCHFNHVFPVLQERGLWGIFYVPTQPYVAGSMLDVHKVHLLCGKYDGIALLHACQKRVMPNMVPFEKRSEFNDLTYQTQSNAAGVSEVKRLLNYFIAETHKSAVINQVADDLGFGAFAPDFYVSPTNLTKMAQAGMVLGSHTISHPVMSKLTRQQQAAELTGSFDYLRSLTDLDVLTYCHPYGGFHSFDANTVDLLDEMGVQYAFNVESRDIEAGDMQSNRQHLPRYDCNEFPFGQAS